jgi:GT2 family glycosyltransferase
MEKTIRITASLVLYKNNPEMIYKTVLSTISTPLKINLCVVDNSPSPDLETVLQDLENVEYYYNKGDNVGFGKAHNIAISKCGVSDYHLVLNPDIYFDENVIPQLIDYLESNHEVGLIHPKIFFFFIVSPTTNEWIFSWNLFPFRYFFLGEKDFWNISPHFRTSEI